MPLYPVKPPSFHVTWAENLERRLRANSNANMFTWQGISPFFSPVFSRRSFKGEERHTVYTYFNRKIGVKKKWVYKYKEHMDETDTTFLGGP